MTADHTTRADVLAIEGVRLGRQAVDRADAVRQCGEVLVEIGAVATPYVAAMAEREQTISTYVGEGVAIPHGTDESRVHVLRTSLAVLTFPAGVQWDGGVVYACVAIAASGSEHVVILSALAEVLMDGGKAEQLRTATDAADVVALLTPDTTEEHTP